MNENKEIEEMTEIIGNTWLVDLEGNTMDVCEVLDEVDINCIARELQNTGYRNVKDKVVLDKEEYEVLKIKEKEKHWLETCMNVWKNAKIDGSNETAEKILNFVADHYSSDFLISELDEYIAKELGLEI